MTVAFVGGGVQFGGHIARHVSYIYKSEQIDVAMHRK